MLPIIRTFRNTDVAALCKVWNAHYGDLGAACRVNPLQMELATLAKPYFTAQDLLIAEYDEQIVGFLHLAAVANDDLGDSLANVAAIAALCTVPCDGEDGVARTLLSQAERVLSERRVELCLFKPKLPSCAFYLGLGPADSMIGATTSERRGCRWVTAAGFSPTLPTSQWQLELADFHPPIDRLQIQIRRSCQVERQADEPALPWWQACLLGHTEPIAFELWHRLEQRCICDALLWTVAMELQTAPEAIAWLWTPRVPDEELGAEHVTFLLGEACRQLQAERVDLLRVATTASDTRVNGILRRLGFTAEQSGMVFEKKLS